MYTEQSTSSKLMQRPLFDAINDETIAPDKKLAIVQDLLKNEANPNASEERINSGRTPLALAYEKGYPAIAEELTRKDLGNRRASLDIRTAEGYTLLHLAVMWQKSEDVKLGLVESLLKDLNSEQREVLLDVQAFDNQTALHKAVIYSDSEDKDARVVKKLIEYGAAVNAETEKHFVPLHFAARLGKFDVVKVLVENGAIVDVKSDVGIEGDHEVQYAVSPKKRALQGGNLAIACYLAQKSRKRLTEALVKGNHPMLTKLLAGDIARNERHAELARECYERLFRKSTVTSSDIRLQVCCLKKLGDLLFEEALSHEKLLQDIVKSKIDISLKEEKLYELMLQKGLLYDLPSNQNTHQTVSDYILIIMQFKAKRFIDATKLYNLALTLYGELSPARQYKREARQLFRRLAEVEIGCCRGQKAIAREYSKNRWKEIKETLMKRGVALKRVISSKKKEEKEAYTVAEMGFSEIYRWTKWCLSDLEMRTKLDRHDTSIQRSMSILNKEAKNFTGKLIKECIIALGKKPPCDYAIISLGSMNWAEMLLSSDLAFGVLLSSNTEKDRQYFQNLINLLMVKLLTVTRAEQMPLQAISCSTSAAQLFLGHIFSPLEVSELFGTPKEMADRQGGKDSAVLANFLKTVNFVYGSQDSGEKLVTTYKTRMEQIINDERAKVAYQQSYQQLKTTQKNEILQWRKSQILLSLEGDLVDFELSIDQEKATKGSLYIKREFHRFLNGVIHKLCLYNNITEENSWERLKKLKDNGIIGANGYDKLCEAMNDIVQLRLQRHSYSLERSRRTKHGQKNEKRPIFIQLNEVDKKSLVKILRVLLPLQNALKTFCNVGGSTDLSENTFYDEGIMSTKNEICISYIAEGEAYERLFDYANAKKWYKEGVKRYRENAINLEARRRLYRVLCKGGDYEDARGEYEYIFGKAKFMDLLTGVSRATLCHEEGVVSCTKVKQILSTASAAVIMRKSNKAMKSCNDCYAVLQTNLSHPMSLVVNAANQKTMGDVERMRKKFKKAREHYTNALSSYEKLQCEYGVIQPLEAIKVKLDLAAVQASLGNVSLALNLCKEAGELCISPMYRYIHGETHLEMQSILQAMEAFCKKEITAKSNIMGESIMGLCKQAIDVCKSLIGGVHIEVARLSKSLGDACYKYYNEKATEYKDKGLDPTGKEQKLLTSFLKDLHVYYETAENIYQENYGDNHTKVTSIQKQRVAIFRALSERIRAEQRGATEESGSYLDYAEILQEKIDQKVGHLQVPTLEQIKVWKDRGNLYFKRAQTTKLLLSRQQIKDLEEKIKREKKELIEKKEAYDAEAKVLAKKKERREEPEYNAQERILLEDEETLKKAKEALYGKEAAYEVAKKDLTQVLTYYQSLPDKDSDPIIEVLEQLASVHQVWGRFSEARNYYEQILSIYKRRKDYPRQASTLWTLGKVCENLAEVEQAIAYRDLAKLYERGEVPESSENEEPSVQITVDLKEKIILQSEEEEQQCFEDFPLDFQDQDVLPDGACLFRAIYLGYQTDTHEAFSEQGSETVRSLSVLWMKSNRNEYAEKIKAQISALLASNREFLEHPDNLLLGTHGEFKAKLIQVLQQGEEAEEAYVNSDECVDDYITHMSNHTSWGGGIELGIVANVLNVQLIVYDDPDAVKPFQKIGDPKAAKIYLLLTGGHYKLRIPK